MEVPTSDLFSTRSLSGHFAVVTGAGSGIGRAVALTLARCGMHLLLVGRREETLRAVAQEAGAHATALAADLTTEAGLAAVVSAVPSKLHVLVHCAGMYLRGGVSETPNSAWTSLEAINLHSPILLTTACIPALRAATGQVVFVNSTAGLQAARSPAPAYAASKHGLRVMTDSLRREVNPLGIRVLSVFPGRTDTPMQDTILAQEGLVAAPGTLIQPDDIALMILASLLLSSSAQVSDITVLPMHPL